GRVAARTTSGRATSRSPAVEGNRPRSMVIDAATATIIWRNSPRAPNPPEHGSRGHEPNRDGPGEKSGEQAGAVPRRDAGRVGLVRGDRLRVLPGVPGRRAAGSPAPRRADRPPHRGPNRGGGPRCGTGGGRRRVPAPGLTGHHR